MPRSHSCFTSKGEAFLDSGATQNLINSPRFMYQRRIVPKPERIRFSHRGIDYYSRICGTVEVCNVNGESVLLDDVWVHPAFPRLTVALKKLRHNSRFDVKADNVELLISLKKQYGDKRVASPFALILILYTSISTFSTITGRSR